MLFSTTHALLVTLTYAFLYIAPFYLSPSLRTSRILSRDTPAIIRARTRAVAIVIVICAALTTAALSFLAHLPPSDILRLLGLAVCDWRDILRLLALVLLLFCGPIYEALLFPVESIAPTSIDQHIRNLVTAPVTEELVFRSLTLPFFLLARLPPYRIVVLAPCVFGLVHMHHLADFWRASTPPHARHPPFAVCLRGLASTAFQISFTSLFGAFATFVFLRTGSVVGPILAHTCCNYFRVPRLWGRVGGDDDHALHPRRPRRSIVWSIIYYSLLPLGAWAFAHLLWPWTASPHALVEFS